MLAQNLIDLLETFGLKKTIIAYVKDKGFNLNAMTFALKSIIVVVRH